MANENEIRNNKEISQISEAFADDKLNRKTVAENFKNILLNADLNVFSVSAQWGGGKTYFIENLIKLMQDDSINILYNAWESDFYDSPLIPLFVELFAELEKYDNDKTCIKLLKSCKKFLKLICEKTTFQIGLKYKAFNCSANFDPNKKSKKSEYLEVKNEIQKLKNNLELIPQKLGKKIIIFVDELDRCNPIYAIKTLEIIKHLFGIPNIIFVLSVDKKQLENSVKRIFGTNVVVNGYLRKFIDVDFQLPDSSNEQLIHYHLHNSWNKIDKFIQSDRYYNYNLQRRIDRYYNYNLQRRIDSFGFARNMDVTQEQKLLSNLISNITSIFNFSARDIEKFFMRFNLFLDILSEKDVLLIEPSLLLNALAMFDIDEFNNYVNVKQLNKYLEINKVLPLWKGMFKDSYRTELFSNTDSSNQQKNLAIKLSSCLQKIRLLNIDEQEKYLQNYPSKIKFINNFDYNE